MFLPLFRDLGARRLMLTGLAASWYVENTGNFEAAASQTGLYLSADGTVTASDTLLATIATPLLAAGASDHKTVSFALPGDLPVGVYYVGAIADTGAQVAEANELDNLSNLVPIVLGNNSANTLTGTAARDTMFGLGGNDTLNGGAGADWLIARRRQGKIPQRPAAKMERGSSARRPTLRRVRRHGRPSRCGPKPRKLCAPSREFNTHGPVDNVTRSLADRRCNLARQLQIYTVATGIKGECMPAANTLPSN